MDPPEQFSSFYEWKKQFNLKSFLTSPQKSLLQSKLTVPVLKQWDAVTHIHSSTHCGYNERQRKTSLSTVSKPAAVEQTLSLRERKTKRADRCQKKLSLNQCNFLPSRLWPKRPFGVFQLFLLFFLLSSLRYIVNRNAHWKAELARGREGLWRGIYLSVCQSASVCVFLRSGHRHKNLVHFLHFRKHFHNFKYNNFLSGKTPGIIHVYLAFIYLFFSPERKGLEKKGGAHR